jgi:hypothetical protein
VTDQLGTHAPGVVDATLLAHPSSADSACAPYQTYGGGFSTGLDGNWSYLAARSEPCRAASSTDGWGTGSTWEVTAETHGEFICASRAQRIGTDVWFDSSKGWSWSGGTSNVSWNSGC